MGGLIFMFVSCGLLVLFGHFTNFEALILFIIIMVISSFISAGEDVRRRK